MSGRVTIERNQIFVVHLSGGAGGGEGGGAPSTPASRSVPTAENLAARDLVNLYNASGTLTARRADADNGRPAHGIVKAASTAPAAADVFEADTVSGFSGLTPGARYFLSTSPGQVTDTPPAAAGAIVQNVGIALSASELRFAARDYMRRA